MGENISISTDQNRSGINRLYDNSTKLKTLQEIIRQQWDGLFPFVVTSAASKLYTVKVGEFTSNETLEFSTLVQDKNIWITGVYGCSRKIKRKIIGYAIAFAARPVIKWFPAYLSITYSNTIQKRDPIIAYTDSNIRVFKFDCDFLLVCRKRVDAHYNNKLPDANTYINYKGVWKDGT